MKIVKTIYLKIVIFTGVKNRCILHGRVFVMRTLSASKLNCSLCNKATPICAVRLIYSGVYRFAPQFGHHIAKGLGEL